MTSRGSVATKPAKKSAKKPSKKSAKKPVRKAATDLGKAVKESNPKDAIGIRKVPFSMLSGPVLAECALGMLEGAIKYRRHNYRVVGVRASVYYDATRRHLDSWWEGEDIDPVSKLNHVTKAITSLMVIRDAMIRGKMYDDRPPGTLGYMDALNVKCAELLDSFSEHKAPYTHEDAPADVYQE